MNAIFKTGPGSGAYDQIVAHALTDATDNHVVVGPLIGRPDLPGIKYFLISTCGPGRDARAGEAGGVRTDQIVVAEDLDGNAERMWVLAAFARRDGLVVHACDDELHAVRLCETLWPGERVTAWRRKVGTERTRRARP